LSTLKKDALRFVDRAEDDRSIRNAAEISEPTSNEGRARDGIPLVCETPPRADGRIDPIIATSLRRPIAIFPATIAGKKKQQPS
jgi:hypothetical protein